jgi:peptidoglycan/LPS O-acetylase OafA/YrhL
LLAFVTHMGFVHTLHASTFFTIVPAFWWLGLLAQLYLICPWLLRCFQRLGTGSACLLACLLPWSAWIGLSLLAGRFPQSPWAMLQYMSYFNLPVRLPEFALGMWLASAWNAGLLPVSRPAYAEASARTPWSTLLSWLVGLVLLGSLPYVASISLVLPYQHFALVGWCLCVVLAVLHWPYAVRLGNTSWVLYLAGASYGIYLLHQPLLGYTHMGLASLASPVIRFLLLLVGIGLLSYYAAVGLNRFVVRLWG